MEEYLVALVAGVNTEAYRIQARALVLPEVNVALNQLGAGVVRSVESVT